MEACPHTGTCECETSDEEQGEEDEIDPASVRTVPCLIPSKEDEVSFVGVVSSLTVHRQREKEYLDMQTLSTKLWRP